MNGPDTAHILVVGAGFGGLQLIHDLKGANVRITLVDQRNHHLFSRCFIKLQQQSLRHRK